MSKSGTNGTPIKKSVQAILESLSKGSSIEKACQHAGFGRSSFYRWLNKSDKNRQKYEEIIDSRTMVVEDSLFNSAVKGSVSAQIFWLKNRNPKRWKDNFHNEGSTGIEINITDSKYERIHQ